MVKHPDSNNTSKKCDLCGLPLRYKTATAAIAGADYAFCCHGCRQVFTILMEASDSPNPESFKETQLFKQCQSKGIIPASEEQLIEISRDTASVGDDAQSNAAKASASIEAPNALTLTLLVSKMWCSACAWVIDKSLQKTQGVIDSTCNFSTDRLQVLYDPIKVSPDQIIQSIGKLGFQAATVEESGKTKEFSREFVRFAVSAFLTMNVMMLSFALYTGFITDFSAENAAKISWPMFVMAGAVLIYGGYDFYKKAWAGLRHAAFSMETLIIIGALSAYFYSTFNLLRGSIHLYYDTAAMLITLVLLGKALERRAKRKVLMDLENFFALAPTKVRICNRDFPDGRYVAIEQLAPADHFRVAENEIIPADGHILAGSGSVDESALTGEPVPVAKKTGDFVRSGTRVQQGEFKVSAEKVGDDATLGQMMQIIEKTLLTKLPIEGKTDVILQWFVPVILAMAAATAVICALSGISVEASILRAVTVMVISCPCALGIAIPLARVAGISIAGKKGILVRDFAAFDMAQRVSAFVFDKTGTVTHGNWTLQEVITLGSQDRDGVFHLAAGLEMDSDHFIAREIRQQAKKRHLQPAKIEQIQTAENGISGLFENTPVKIGSAGFMGDTLIDFKKEYDFNRIQPTSTDSYVFMSIGDSPAAIFAFGDTLRSGARTTIEQLQQRGLKTQLVSGDGIQTTRAVAEAVGIPEAFGGQTPNDKVAAVKALQKQNHLVAMVGDGINDAPALVQADLSLAVHSGAHLGEEVAAVTLMRAEPEQVIDFLTFSTVVNQKIHQNLVFTFAYNVISIPIAMSGLLNPLVAVCAMLLSSISVIGNTLMLVRKHSAQGSEVQGSAFKG
ncbi:MAG: heavy metal translocating P-type ATPase [Desulfobacterales bacterium]|nr:heavy metal translocating P-type ATPase [Desulfobacterales bacterium]